MKTLKFYCWALFLVLTSISFTACSKDDDSKDVDPDPLVESHFDIWVSIGSNSGMGSDNTQLVKNIKSLEEQSQIDFKNSGTDVTSKLYQESIIKGQYYYQIPKEKDRFGKYQIVDGKITTVAEIPFVKNTLKDRRYTHAWVNDTTLVLIGSNGKSDKILWIRVNTDQMKIVSEGELNLPAPATGDTYNTSGIARFNDGRIIYAFVYSKVKTSFNVAFINPKDMSTEKVVNENRAEFMAGTAYGELLQNKTFVTPSGDYYLACNSVVTGAKSNTQQHGTLLRIKKGTITFDASYKGYNYAKGKIVTVDCLNDSKALLYIQDPEHTGAAGWGSDYNCYYAILDLNTDKLEEIKYNGAVLPYSAGTFSQRSMVFGNKAYIGVNPKNSDPCIYIYDIKTGAVTKGLSITKGYLFDRIVTLKD